MSVVFEDDDNVDGGPWVGIKMVLEVPHHLHIIVGGDNNVNVELVVLLEILDLIRHQRFVGNWHTSRGIAIRDRVKTLSVFLMQDNTGRAHLRGQKTLLRKVLISNPDWFFALAHVDHTYDAADVLMLLCDRGHLGLDKWGGFLHL